MLQGTPDGGRRLATDTNEPSAGTVGLIPIGFLGFLRRVAGVPEEQQLSLEPDREDSGGAAGHPGDLSQVARRTIDERHHRFRKTGRPGPHSVWQLISRDHHAGSEIPSESVQPPGLDQVTRGVARLFRVGRNVTIHDTRLARAIRDHGDWVAERDQQLQQLLVSIDNSFEAKGTFHSGMRLKARVDAKAAAVRELKKARDRLGDVSSDLVNEETFLERTYRRLRKRPLVTIDISDREAEIEQRWRVPEGGQDGMPVLDLPI